MQIVQILIQSIWGRLWDSYMANKLQVKIATLLL